MVVVRGEVKKIGRPAFGCAGVGVGSSSLALGDPQDTSAFVSSRGGD